MTMTEIFAVPSNKIILIRANITYKLSKTNARHMNMHVFDMYTTSDGSTSLRVAIENNNLVSSADEHMYLTIFLFETNYKWTY